MRTKVTTPRRSLVEVGGYDRLFVEKPGYRGWNNGSGLTVSERDLDGGSLDELDVTVPSRYLYSQDDYTVVRFRTTSEREGSKRRHAT